MSTPAPFPAEPSPVPAIDEATAREVLKVLQDLLAWEAYLGGWQADVWRRARRVHAKATRRLTP